MVKIECLDDLKTYMDKFGVKQSWCAQAANISDAKLTKALKGEFRLKQSEFNKIEREINNNLIEFIHQ
ncbi:hypothetical protein [Paenibacillus elgii]|uniref:hypothetical protein n=1 Tax=Paenibacillus elgii TaxID=189691 RepID=UPI00203ED990|nr:hypothetical protein [Paenibacillus elgii]MCM3273047.1 hypothetical protein [Paenibacillus elgii]